MPKISESLLPANDWLAQVWTKVEPLAQTWAKEQAAPDKSKVLYTAYIAAMEHELRTKNEVRGVVINAATLDPTKVAVPKDVITLAKAKVPAHYFFYNSKDRCNKT